MGTTQSQADDYPSDLLGLTSGLNDWEVNFVDDMATARKPFSDKQKIKLEQIWNKHCANIITHN